MGIFGNSSPFDQDVERATSENNTSEEWGLIMEICDRAGASGGAGREALRAVLRRLAHPDPHVQVHAATLLDALVANAGRAFRLEVASRDFEQEFRRLLARAQPPVRARLRALLRKWAEGDFKDDPQLDLIPSLHAKLQAEHGRAASPHRAPDAAPPATAAAAAAAAAAAREQDDLARAIALSLSEAALPAPAPPAAAAPELLYPRVDAESPRRVRALYDFEAAEDNELTFSAGETVHVLDSSDPNWWKGRNARGAEGLFPANFVRSGSASPEPAAAGARACSPAAARAVEAEALCIDEGGMDLALAALHEADPHSGAADPPALDALERRALSMGALVDCALERADTRHARLTQLSAELVDALNLYHELMREREPPARHFHAPPPAPGPPQPPPPPHHYLPPQPTMPMPMPR